MNLPSPGRRESIAVAALTLLGAVLRFWDVGRLGLNHFDEGIYALAGRWIESPKLWPGIASWLGAYAPPGFPTLVGLSYAVFGTSDLAAILVSLVAGVATIPVAAWVARRSFGPGAGAAAAAFAALGGPQIAFSRMALTDATFLLVWLAAIGLGGLLLERPALGRALFLGLAVGCAQNVKYNGWLAGIAVALAVGLGPVGEKPGPWWRWYASRLALGLAAGVVAFAVYWPWFSYVQSQPGGYAGLLAHHRSYLRGPSEWPRHWSMQMGQATALSGSLAPGLLNWGLLAWALAWLGSAVVGLGDGVWDRRRFVWSGAGLVLGSLGLGLSASFAWWVSLASLPWLLRDVRPGARMIGVAWLLMAVLTPFYHPYARLMLPLHGLNGLVLAGLVVGLQRSGEAGGRARAIDSFGRLRLALLALAFVAALTCDLTAGTRPRPSRHLLDPSDSLRLACDAAARRIDPSSAGSLRAVRLFGRPPIQFYLMRKTNLDVTRVADDRLLLAQFQPGELLVYDGALASAAEIQRARTGIPGLDLTSEATFEERCALPLTTLLDSEPGAVGDPNYVHVSSLWFARPRLVSAAPDANPR